METTIEEKTDRIKNLLANLPDEESSNWLRNVVDNDLQELIDLIEHETERSHAS